MVSKNTRETLLDGEKMAKIPKKYGKMAFGGVVMGKTRKRLAFWVSEPKGDEVEQLASSVSISHSNELSPYSSKGS